MIKSLKAIDLFCGAGGFSLGLKDAGFDVLVGIDKFDGPVKTYQHNFGVERGLQLDLSSIQPHELKNKVKNVTRTKINDLDLIVGGPPCQGFSLASRRKDRGSKEDIRNDLSLKYFEFIREINPKYFIFENVAGLLSALDGEWFQLIEQKIHEISNYEFEYEIKDTADYGIPQHRKRLLIVGTRNDQEKPKKTKKSNLKVTVKNAISDLATDIPDSKLDIIHYETDPENDYQKEMRKYNKSLINHFLRKHTSEVQEFFMGVREGTSGKFKKRTHYKFNRNDLAPTITGQPYYFIHYELPRVPTLRELARLQSFPDTFEFKGTRTTGGHRRGLDVVQEQQVGNSVPPLMAKAVGLSINNILKN